MNPDRRARASAVLGLLSMLLACTGCISCGAGYVLAVPLGLVGWMFGRAAARVEVEESRRGSEASAWASIGIWSSCLGGGFSGLVVITLILWIVGWSLGITAVSM